MIVAGICMGAVAWFFNQSSHTLFSIEPSEVKAITLRNGNKVTQVVITDPDQIKDIVKLINDFTYTSTKKIPPAGGWSYCISLETTSGDISFEFWSGGVKLDDEDGEPGASIRYIGKTGYFDTLVMLAENATDPM